MRRLLLAVSLVSIATSAFAQDSALMDRLGRLERDMNFLQRQVYTGAPAGDPNAMPAATGAGAAQLDVRISGLEEQMRALRGQVEQAQYAATEAQREHKKFAEDMEYRLQAIEQAQSAAANAAPVTAPSYEAEPTPVEEPAAPVSNTPAGYQPSVAAPAPAATGGDFPNSNAHYNYAFKLLNDKKYSEAATSFDSFVRDYPKDPLTSNAYYWLGESYYARGDYTRAAEGFRKGFESNPQGQKAPDNLLKLAMSLDNIKRTSEACIVLKQVVGKYGESAPRTKERAEAERSRMQCK